MLLKKIFKNSAVVLLGLLFLFSAYSKLVSIEQFEIQLAGFGITNWQVVKYLTRIIVSFEFFIGFMYLFQLKMTKITFPISFFLLIGFTFFSIYQLLFVGETQNCGCFGELIEFNFKETILKNLATLLLIFIVWKITAFKEWFFPKKTTLVVILILIFSIQLVVIIQPPFDIYNQKHQTAIEENTAFLTEFENNAIPKQWYEGEKLLVFVSTSCKYCKQVVAKMGVQYPIDKYKSKILLVVVETEPQMMEEFYKALGIQFQYTTVSKSDFIKTTKGRFPQLFYLKDGIVVKNIGKNDFFESNFDF